MRIPVILWYVLNEPEPGTIIETYNHWEPKGGDSLTPYPYTEAQEKAWRGRRWKRVDGFINATGAIVD